MAIIEESDMQFGEYPDGDVFYLEKSNQYRKELMKHGVKCCEFILKRWNIIYFIEAKKSCPKQIDASDPKEKIEKYNQYISDILTKMKDSLSIYTNILLKRYSEKEVPSALLSSDLSDKKIKLVLVVKNAESHWLIPLSEKLNKEFHRELYIWKISQIFVINEQKAREKHFIL